MIIDAKKLAAHLRAIYCDGAFVEVVLHGCFEARAITVDQILMVDAGPLDGAELLPYPIGIIDLGRLIKMVDYMAKGMSLGEERINLSFDESRGELVVGCKDYGVVHLVTANPWVVGTACDDSTAHLIEDQLPRSGGRVLCYWAVQKILSMIGLMKAQIVGLRLSAVSGRVVMEGYGEYSELPYDFSWWTGPDCWLWFRPHYLAGVLKQVDDSCSWTLRIDEPDSMVVISNEKYLYILSPEDADPSEDRRWEERCSQPGARNQPIQPSPLLLGPAAADVEEAIQ